MKSLSTKYSVEETFMTALCDWMEHGAVNFEKFPIEHKAALQSQDHIGWRHIFSGKLSQKWLALQGDVALEDGKFRNDYLWGASIVETILRQFIALWELRNEEVHGKTEEVQEHRRKHRLIGKIRELDKLKADARPSDMGLFHNDLEKYIEESNARTIANYISSHTKAIKNSVAKWKKGSQTGVTSIIHWVRGLNDTNNAALEKIQTIQRDRLLGDGRKKERRRKAASVAPSARQIPITNFISLTNRIT